MKKFLSIVTPTYNEEGNIKELCYKISEEMKKTSYDYEHIVIDNSSTDATIDILKELAVNDKKLKIIINSRNFGHIKSPIHGLMQANGEAIILMSSDFQDPPELISRYIKEWEKGFDVVLAQKETSDENIFKYFFKNIFYKFINKISETSLMLNTTGAGLFDKKIINEIRKIDDPYPYFRGLLSEITSNIKLIKFHQPKRSSGTTKNNFYTLYDIGILGIIKHSKIPLRIMTFVGFCTSLISIFIAFFYLVKKLLLWESFDLGLAPLVIGLFGIASIQIFLLGFIGEYVMNILVQARKLPLVIEKERINF
jgi:glycosyltransferase involved in cell wall biosynthesis